MTLGRRLKELRNKSGITQTKLAEEIGIAPSTVSLYESDRREPDYNILIRLSSYFDTSIDYLLGLTDEPEDIVQSSTVYIEELLRRSDLRFHLKGKELSEADKKDFLHVLNFIFKTRK